MPQKPCRFPLLFCLICFFTVLPTVRGYAQSTTTGATKGLVHEEGNNQAGIPGALVTILNQATGQAENRLTNSLGNYYFDFVKPGLYTISASREGYEQIVNSTVQGLLINFGEMKALSLPPIALRKTVVAPTPATPPPTPTTLPTPPPPTANLSATQLINLEDATRSANFDARTLTALPLPGSRTFDQFAFLVAGVAPSPQTIGNTVGPGVGPGVGTSGQFAVNGLRSRANNFMVDGSDNNDEDIGVRRQGFTALVPQSIDSLQEFRVVTLLPRSQYGRNLGAQVNAISRDGGKEFHGALYGFFTDSRLKARDAFDLTNGQADFLKRSDGARVKLFDATGKHDILLPDPVKGEDPYTRGQYGFVLGGPVTKKRTFFFGSFERQDLNASKESNFAVPTVAERGLFGSGETGLRVLAGGQVQSVFPTTIIGDVYFSLFPFPNNPRGPYGPNTFTEQLPASADATIFSYKLDQGITAFGKEHTLTGRYNFTDDKTTLPVTGEALFSTLRARVRTQNLSLFFITGALTSRLSNEARLSYGRTRLNFDEVRDPALLPSGLSNVPFLLNRQRVTNATLPGDVETVYEVRPGGTEAQTAPIGQVIVSGYSPVGVDVFNFPQQRVNNTFQIADTASYNLTRQSLTGGVDVRRTQLNSRLDRNFRSVAYFSGSLDVSAQLGIRNAVTPPAGFFTGADFVAAGAATGFFQTQVCAPGPATSSSQAQSCRPDSTIGLRYWQENLFFSDQFRLSDSFKLTLGLRYELNTVPREVNRRIEATFASNEVKKLIAAEKALSGVSGFERYLAGREIAADPSIFRGDHNNLAPHIAFAWDPFGTGKTAVRGGYSIYYDQIPGAVISQSRSVFPSFLTINLAGISNSRTDLTPFNPSLLSVSGTLNTFNFNTDLFRGKDFTDVLLVLNQFANQSPVAGSYFAASPGFVLPAADLATPYAQHWGLTIEREARRDLLLSLAYVGTKGTHLLRLATPNLGQNAIPVITGGLFQGAQIAFTGFLASAGQNFRRPFPLLGSFTSIESDGNSIYHGLQAEASMRVAQGFQFTTAYTWSHAIDEVSDLFELAGARGLPQNSFNRRAERADANFDVRHRFVESFIWDLPISAQNKLLGGWQLAGIITLQTGQPFTVYSSIDVNLDGNLTDRLNSLNGVREVNEGSLRYAFPTTPAAQFALLAQAGRDGAVGRNTFRAPGVAVMDLAANKMFVLTERHRIEFRTECFNLLNRTHFGIPAHQLFAPGLGRAVNTTVPGRTVQFAVRYRF